VHQLTLELVELAVFAQVGAKIPMGDDIEHTDEVDAISRITSYWNV